MKVWVMVALSCQSCGSGMVKVLDHQPNEQERQDAEQKECFMGTCGQHAWAEIEVNGPAQDFERGYY